VRVSRIELHGETEKHTGRGVLLKKVFFLLIFIYLFENSVKNRIPHNRINTDPFTVRTHQPVEYRSINLLQYNSTIPKKNAHNPYV
jgi:hypothetical protein